MPVPDIKCESGKISFGAMSSALFLGSVRLHEVYVWFTSRFHDGFAVELARREYEGMESLSIPFTRILKITTSPSYKESQCQEFGISMDLDEISSRKLAVLYAAALKDERKKVIFYDLTWIDKPKMTITVLLKGRNAICDCLKGLQRWVNQGNRDTAMRGCSSSNEKASSPVAYVELPGSLWDQHLRNIGVLDFYGCLRRFWNYSDENDENYQENNRSSPAMGNVTKKLRVRNRELS